MVDVVEALAIKYRVRPFVHLVKDLKEEGKVHLDRIRVGVGYDGQEW